MNKQRRTALEDLKTRMTEGDLASLINEVKAELEGLMEEEREAFENLPESLQDGEQGQLMDQAATNLEEAAEMLDPETLFEDVIQYIDDAIE